MRVDIHWLAALLIPGRVTKAIPGMPEEYLTLASAGKLTTSSESPFYDPEIGNIEYEYNRNRNEIVVKYPCKITVIQNGRTLIFRMAEAQEVNMKQRYVEITRGPVYIGGSIDPYNPSIEWRVNDRTVVFRDHGKFIQPLAMLSWTIREMCSWGRTQGGVRYCGDTQYHVYGKRPLGRYVSGHTLEIFLTSEKRKMQKSADDKWFAKDNVVVKSVRGVFAPMTPQDLLRFSIWDPDAAAPEHAYNVINIEPMLLQWVITQKKKLVSDPSIGKVTTEGEVGINDIIPIPADIE